MTEDTKKIHISGVKLEVKGFGLGGYFIMLGLIFAAIIIADKL